MPDAVAVGKEKRGGGGTLPEKCPLCGGELSDTAVEARDFLTHVPGTFVYNRCGGCGTYVQRPLPSQDFLTHCYESRNLGYFQPFDREVLEKAYRSAAGSVGRRVMYRVFPALKTVSLLPGMPPPARVLDVGSSYGARLYHLAREGYSVSGIELNDEMVRFGRDRLGLDLREGLVEDVSFPAGSFDVIIMSMVLEHCLDPGGTLARVAGWLRPGGELLLSLPCCDGFEFRLYKECCYVIHAPYHLFVPSMAGIYSLLRPCFDVRKTAFQFFHRDLVASAESASSIKGGILYRAIGNVGTRPAVKRAVRAVLFVLTRLGLRTSRVSLRCVKR